MLENWKLDKSKQIFKTSIFNVLQKNYTKPRKTGKFQAYVLDVPDWVMIIGFNVEGNILLIKQFRFGTNKIELEIPAGYVEQYESPKEAAIRELKEEAICDGVHIMAIGKEEVVPDILAAAGL